MASAPFPANLGRTIKVYRPTGADAVIQSEFRFRGPQGAAALGETLRYFFRYSAGGYNRGMSRLRRLVLSDRYFFITCRVHRLRRNFNELEFSVLAEVVGERREERKFLLTAWVFLPDHGRAIIFPPSPLTIDRVMEAIKVSARAALIEFAGRMACFFREDFSTAP